MTILETEIQVTLHPSNYNHYENKGYIIPRTKNNRGKMVVPKNSKLLVNTNDLPEESHQKVTKICDLEHCRKQIPNQRYGEIIRARKLGDGLDRCKKCARIEDGNNRKNNIKYENSLAYYVLENDKNYLLEEYSNKNKKNPSQISFGTHDEYLWNCSKCTNEFQMRVSSRTNGNQNCPYCSGKKVKIGFNDLWSTHPEIAKLLKNPKRAYELTYGSGEREELKCNECGFEQKKQICNVVHRGFSCLCSDGISYPEKFMMSFLYQLNIEYTTQFKFNWSIERKYDFFIPSLNLIIETHGRQHYEESFSRAGGKNLKEEQENDYLKENMAKGNGIDNYIVIDCRNSELEFIKNNIIQSELSKIFNMDFIDWNKCAEYACNSLVKLVCELWKKIKSSVEIAKTVNLERGTVVKYLKRGVELGWCDYNPVNERNKGLNSSDNRKQIVQLMLNGSYIKTWSSMKELADELKINRNRITAVCKGKRESVYGHKWMYEKDYKM